MLRGYPLSRPVDDVWFGLTTPGRGVTDRLFMSEQTSTNGVLIDYSGNGHHGYYGGVKRAFIGDDITGPRVCLFGAVASNTVTVAGLSNSTIYDLIITYHDDTTDTHTLTTSGAGLMTMTASSDAKFTSERVKSVAIYADGGTPLVDTVDFTAQAQGTRSFVTGAVPALNGPPPKLNGSAHSIVSVTVVVTPGMVVMPSSVPLEAWPLAASIGLPVVSTPEYAARIAIRQTDAESVRV